MSRPISASKKLKKQTSVGLFQRYQKIQKRSKNGSKYLPAKHFGKSAKSQVPGRYEVVNVRCKLPSSTGIVKKPVKNENEEYLKKFRERQKQIREKYSPPKMQEIYVNPSKNKIIRKKFNSETITRTPKKVPMMDNFKLGKYTIIVATNRPVLSKSLPNNANQIKFPLRLPPVVQNLPLDVKSTPACSVTKKEIAINTEPSIVISTDGILSEAHRMIWFWFFNGMLPANLRHVISEPKVHQ